MSASSPTAAAPRRVLVTGVSGQDGWYLCRRLVAEGSTVFGLVREPEVCDAAGVTPIAGDLRDADSLCAAVAIARPDEVYNLAAVTFVPDSFDSPALVHDINALGLERLAAALWKDGGHARLAQASSAEIFGPPTGLPQNEEHPLLASSPYGKSKAQAHRFVAALRESEGRFACSAILFNHESPRRPPSFVTRKITRAAARIARGLETTVALGNLGAARDWGYAPEYMDAMVRMLRAEAPRDYVVATGRSATVGDFAALAFARVGLDWTNHVVSDPAFARAGDQAARIGDASRIARDLGWKATTSLEELVAMMVDTDLALLDEPAGSKALEPAPALPGD
jgi:GDPmannose 4,6-dehydratase